MENHKSHRLGLRQDWQWNLLCLVSAQVSNFYSQIPTPAVLQVCPGRPALQLTDEMPYEAMAVQDLNPVPRMFFCDPERQAGAICCRLSRKGRCWFDTRVSGAATSCNETGTKSKWRCCLGEDWARTRQQVHLWAYSRGTTPSQRLTGKHRSGGCFSS